MHRGRVLRGLLKRDSSTILMEVHNALTSKLAHEAGFEALWGSGLAISASMGVRDSNEASWTQVLEVIEFITDAVEAPLLVDGDTGFGNFNNARRLVKKLEQRGVAGVCIEDKVFPKTNSFLENKRSQLASTEEFVGKIRASCDARQCDEFVIVARVEALIAGLGLAEALERASAYEQAGADAIFIHSKRTDGADILAFMEAFRGAVPVLIAPTTYPEVPLARFVEKQLTNFIFSNQAVRTVIAALQRNLKVLRQTEDLMSIENEIAPLGEVFRLQEVDELLQAERRYLPDRKRPAPLLTRVALPE